MQSRKSKKPFWNISKEDCDNIMFFLIGIFSILLILTCLSLYMDFKDNKMDIKKAEILSEGSLNRTLWLCGNKSLEETSECLNSLVNEIFKYNSTDDDEVLTLEELIERGGDCKNWAELYVEMAEELNYNATYYRMTIEEGVFAHSFAVIHDKTGYCVLDQDELIGCVKFALEDNSTIEEISNNGTEKTI